MFITFTIDTAAVKKPKVRMQQNRFDAARGWRKAIHVKKRSLIQKFAAWKKGLKRPQYKMAEVGLKRNRRCTAGTARISSMETRAGRVFQRFPNTFPETLDGRVAMF